MPRESFCCGFLKQYPNRVMGSPTISNLVTEIPLHSKEQCLTSLGADVQKVANGANANRGNS